MTETVEPPSSSFVQRTTVDLATSDIRALVRAQLRELERENRRWASETVDRVRRAHHLDAAERITAFLDGPERR